MKKSVSEPSLEELMSVIEQIENLIEDNNQNIKDCTQVLIKIKKQVCPEKTSFIKRAITKLLNKK